MKINADSYQVRCPLGEIRTAATLAGGVQF
jgi:hypothetical protein